MIPTSSELDQTVVQALQEVWRSSICQTLTQVSGEECVARFLGSSPSAAKDEASGAWTLFSASAQLTGEVGFVLSKPDAAVLNRRIKGKTSDGTAEPGGDPDDSVTEFFRVVVETASTALTAKTKGQVEFRFRGAEPPSWESTSGFRLELHGGQEPPVAMGIVMDETFTQSATQILASCALPVPHSEHDDVIPGLTPISPSEDNIGLFLDIELEATLRFGEREISLREILNLNSGSVIELNRRVNEPVELLVRGKVVAKGDVVVLDGNYALRVTQIANPGDRMSSLAIR